ncbi:MAG TPA: DUF3300 domain-containing protein [Terracidiphilus sp.]|jgi:hypothetical protein
MKPESSIALRQFAPRSHPRLVALAVVPLLALFAQQTLQAQQSWPQNPPYQNPQYVQANPNYAPYPQNQQPAYAQQQDPYNQQYSQQPYADPGQQADLGGQYDQQYAPQQPQQTTQPFAAAQLEQLVAPIALYPDNLIAQILAASTYPAQVVAADNWLRSQGYASPDQIAYEADAQANWDPSVKALTAFPQVLDLMNRDLSWTTDLGNAYYNQPQDILQTIQVMRQRAEDAGTLQSTPQEAVSSNQGYIQLAPTNPQVVYVPAYNPWDVYGQPVSPYPGFSLIGALQSFAGSGAVRYGLGIALSAFSHTPFGWAGWALNWLTSSIFFHQSPYYSQSTSVAHWGNAHGGYYGSQRAGINRTPNGYPRPQQGYNRFGNQAGSQAFARPPVRTAENYGYNRAQQRLPQPVRPQAYARPGGYGNGFYSNSQQAYAARPYANPQQTWRVPAAAYQRNDYAQRAYAQRSYADQRSYSGGRGYTQSYAQQEHFGGSRMFGGGHGGETSHVSYKASKMPKAPKAPKMSRGHSSGGGHHGGGLFHHSR